MLAAVYCGYLLLARRLPGPTRLDLPAAALVGVYVLAVADSGYPRVSLDASLLLSAVLIVFFAAHDLSFLSVAALMRGLAALGAAGALFALLRVGEDYALWLRLVEQVEGGIGLSDLLPPAVPRFHDPSVLVNVLAMALNLCWPFALALALERRPRLERGLAAAAAMLVLLALFFSLSRGAWLGAAAAMAVFGALLLLRSRDPAALTGRLLRSRLLGATAVAAFLAVILAGAVLAARWESRPEWLFRPSVSPRYDALSTGWQIFRDRPLLGAGPYTYSLLYGAYSGKYPVENIHPHNGYLNVLVDTGVAGGLALLAGGIVLGATMLRGYREADAARRLQLAACAAALASLAVHSLVDSPNAWTTALLPLAVVLALTLRLCPAPAGGAAPLRRLSRALPLALIALLATVWLLADIDHARYERSLELLHGGRFQQGASEAARAADGERSNAAYQLNAGVQQAIVWLRAAETSRAPDPRLLAGARRYLERTIEREPRSAIAYANLAVLESLQAARSPSPDWQPAVDAARTVLALAPGDGTLATVAASVLEQADLRVEAALAYGRALDRDAALLQSPYWAAQPGRLDLRKDALAFGTALTACEIGRVTTIYRGYDDDREGLAADCAQLVREKPNDALARSSLAIILHGLGRDADARREVEAAVARVPDNPFVLTARAIVNCAASDVALVRHDLVRAAFQGDPDAALLLAYTYRPPPPGNPVPANVRLPSQPGDLPNAVLDRVRDLLPSSAPMVFDGGQQNYLLGILYYRVRFLRESPSSILIPEEWITLASPRANLLLEVSRSQRRP